MLYAIIDIGSSTIRMAIYNIDYGKMELLMKKKHMLGLAAYVKDGVLQQKGIDKACEVLNRFRDFLDSFKIKNVSAFTTAAVRNAKNCNAVIDELKQRTQIDIRVITGQEEAQFDFIGVMHDIRSEKGLIVDVGGASTELIAYADSAIMKKISIPVGALLLYTKYVEDFLPSSAEIGDMQEQMKSILNSTKEFVGVKEKNICAIGGTAKSMRLLYNAMFDCEAANKQMQVIRFSEMITRYTRDKKLLQDDLILLLKTAPDRLKTVISGMIIINEICHKFAVDTLVYSDTGMREGFIYDQIIEDKK